MRETQEKLLKTKGQRTYKYSVVHFLKFPNIIDEYVYVPNSWMKFRNAETQRVVVAYPLDEDQEVTKKRVLEQQEYVPHWKFYSALVKYDTDYSNDAEEYIKWKNIRGESPTMERRTRSTTKYEARPYILKYPYKRPWLDSKINSSKKQRTAMNSEPEEVKNHSDRESTVEETPIQVNSNGRSHIADICELNVIDHEAPTNIKKTQSVMHSANKTGQSSTNTQKRAIEALHTQNSIKTQCTDQSSTDATCSLNLAHYWSSEIITSSPNVNHSQLQTPTIVIRRTTGRIPLQLTHRRGTNSISTGINSSNIANQCSLAKNGFVKDYGRRLIPKDPKTQDGKSDRMICAQRIKLKDEDCVHQLDADEDDCVVYSKRYKETQLETVRNSDYQPVDRKQLNILNDIRDFLIETELFLANNKFLHTEKYTNIRIQLMNLSCLTKVIDKCASKCNVATASTREHIITEILKDIVELKNSFLEKYNETTDDYKYDEVNDNSNPSYSNNHRSEEKEDPLNNNEHRFVEKEDLLNITDLRSEEKEDPFNNYDHRSEEKEDPLKLMLKNRWTYAEMYLYEVNRNKRN